MKHKFPKLNSIQKFKNAKIIESRWQMDGGEGRGGDDKLQYNRWQDDR